MCVYKHISILLHYSFFLFIYLFLSQTCIKTNSSEHTTTSLIPNGKRPLFSIPSSLLRRVPSANRSIITWKRKERKEMREKLAYRPVLHLSIFILKENKGSTIGRASERKREREVEGEKDSTALQPTPRAHHHISQFASISTRSSNSSSSNNSSNKHE